MTKTERLKTEEASKMGPKIGHWCFKTIAKRVDFDLKSTWGGRHLKFFSAQLKTKRLGGWVGTTFKATTFSDQDHTKRIWQFDVFLRSFCGCEWKPVKPTASNTPTYSTWQHQNVWTWKVLPHTTFSRLRGVELFMCTQRSLFLFRHTTPSQDVMILVPNTSTSPPGWPALASTSWASRGTTPGMHATPCPLALLVSCSLALCLFVLLPACSACLCLSGVGVGSSTW